MAYTICTLLLLLQATLFCGASLSLGSQQFPVVEHLVVWSLSGLDTKSESLVLEALLDLRSAPEVLSLSTGRLVKKVDNRYNYALFARFPSLEALRNYYNLCLPRRVIPLMTPFIEEEYTVDYGAYIDPFDRSKIENATVHITMMNIKNETSESVVQAALNSIKSLAYQMHSVIQITAGENNYDRDTVFSHAFVAHLVAESDSVKNFYSHPSYKLVEKKLLRICDKVISVDYPAPNSLLEIATC